MKLSFCNCVLDLSTRQVWRGGRLASLEPKMYELLEVLIQRRPAVVTNRELDEILWPNVYVERTSLTRLVSELRAVLGDTPRDSRIIRTAYKTGYAFCAIANVASSPPPAPSAAASADVVLVWNDVKMPLLDGVYIAGRGSECSLVIDANTVSRRHAQFTIGADSVIVEDLGSTNGTHVNGAQIFAPTILAHGHKIELGSEVLVLKKRDSAARTVRMQRD